MLKRDSDKNKKILEAELKLGKQFSPDLYKEIISFKDQSKIKYALKMRRVDAKSFTGVIKEMRRENKNFLNSEKMGGLIEKIISKLIEGYNRGELLFSNNYLSAYF